MGLLSNLFSSKPAYPEIDPASDVAKRIAEVEPQLDELAGKISEPLEVVPAKHAAYVFIGKPPKKFGLAWVHDGKVSGLNTLVEEHGLKPAQIDHIMEELRDAYQRNSSAEHYCTTVHGRTVTVTTSDKLEHEVHEIIEEILH